MWPDVWIPKLTRRLGWSLHHWTVVIPKHLFSFSHCQIQQPDFQEAHSGTCLASAHSLWWSGKTSSSRSTWRIYRKVLCILPLNYVHILTCFHSPEWYPPCERPVRTQCNRDLISSYREDLHPYCRLPAPPVSEAAPKGSPVLATRPSQKNLCTPPSPLTDQRWCQSLRTWLLPLSARQFDVKLSRHYHLRFEMGW